MENPNWRYLLQGVEQVFAKSLFMLTLDWNKGVDLSNEEVRLNIIQEGLRLAFTVVTGGTEPPVHSNRRLRLIFCRFNRLHSREIEEFHCVLCSTHGQGCTKTKNCFLNSKLNACCTVGPNKSYKYWEIYSQFVSQFLFKIAKLDIWTD